MHRKALRSDTFKDAYLHIAYRENGIDAYKAEYVSICADALEAFMEQAPFLAEDPALQPIMLRLDIAIRKFYPHHVRWDNPTLRDLVSSMIAVLRNTVAGRPVPTPTLQQVHQFLERVWIELSSLEAQQCNGKK